MRHRRATVAMIGACMLAVLWGLGTGAWANEFYTAGTADQIDGADNLGKTVVHYASVLGFPLLSAGLLAGGVIKMRRDPGSGGGLLASGIGAGYIAAIVNNLHSNAAASVALVPLVGGQGVPGLALSLVLQAAVVASAVLYVRRRTQRCGSAAGTSLTSR